MKTEGEVGGRRRRILYSCSICCANFSVILVRTTVELMESPPPFFTCRTQRASGHTTTGKMGPLLKLLYSLAMHPHSLPTLCPFSGYANMGTSLCTVNLNVPFSISSQGIFTINCKRFHGLKIFSVNRYELQT